jgi:hypothetical protein
MKRGLAVWVLIGIALGIFMREFTPPVRAQQPAASAGRITETFVASIQGRNVHFVKDAVSGDCWIALLSPKGTESSIAQATSSACK